MKAGKEAFQKFIGKKKETSSSPPEKNACSGKGCGGKCDKCGGKCGK